MRLSLETRQRNIAGHFHIYWRPDQSAFLASPPYRHRKGTESIVTDAAHEVTGLVDEEEWERESRIERRRLTAYASRKSRHEKVFRIVEGYRPETERWNEYISIAIYEMGETLFRELTGSPVIVSSSNDTTNPATVKRGGPGAE